MVIGPFFIFVPGSVDGIEIVTQTGAISNNEAQRPDAISDVSIPGEAQPDGQEARALTIPIFPALAEFLRDRRRIRVTPLEFECDIGCAPLVVEGRGRVCSTQHIVFNTSLTSAKGVETIGAQI